VAEGAVGTGNVGIRGGERAVAFRAETVCGAGCREGYEVRTDMTAGG
jgi:hypothetical protein